MLTLVVLFKSYDSITLILLFRFASERLSIQYVYERVFFLTSLVFQSGCKTKTSFCFSQEKFKKNLKLFFRFLFLNFSSSLSMNFRVLRGANVKAFFKSHKLFLIFFLKNFSVLISSLVSLSVNVFRCCGCKSRTFIYIYKPFFYIFSIFFISRWYLAFYKVKFFSWFYLYWGFWRFGFALPDSAAKALKRKVWFFAVLFNLAETQRRRISSFFSSGNVLCFGNFILQTHALAPIEVEILLFWGSK